MAAFAAHPKVREAVYKHRFVQTFEAVEMEKAALDIKQFFFIRATAILRAGLIERLSIVIPEIKEPWEREPWSHHELSPGGSQRSDCRALSALFPRAKRSEDGRRWCRSAKLSTHAALLAEAAQDSA